MTDKNFEPNTGACPAFEPLLEDHLTGELGGTDAANVSQHLASCAGCRAAVEYARPSVALLKIAEPAADPGPGFAHLTMAQIRHSQAELADEKSIWAPFVSLAWKFAATAAVALALLITVDISSHRNDGYAPSLNPADDAGLFSDAPGNALEHDDFLVPAGDANHGNH